MSSTANGDWSAKRYAAEEAAHLSRIYNDYYGWAAKAERPEPDQPEPGIYRKTFEPPKEWGEITERTYFTSPWGRPCEGLLLSKHGWIKRLTVGIQGFD